MGGKSLAVGRAPKHCRSRKPCSSETWTAKTLYQNLDFSPISFYSLSLTVQALTGVPLDLQCLFISPLHLFPISSSLVLPTSSILTLHLPLLGGTQPPAALFRCPSYNSFNSKPPPNYVAGSSCGGTDFTTRSDIGPGIYSTAFLGVHKYDEDDEDDEDYLRKNRKKFDDFEDCDMGLFDSAGSDDRDYKTNTVWESVDEYMASRHKDRKEKRAKLEMDKYLASNPIQQFSNHIKRDLAAITPEQWDNIPEA
ncbi:hypothetical protein J5N97_013602 [Dioscorea zingiberensis]|uniref:PRP1 splicing factor N-terminal domain-containing protein n=1 Tax=Dioscorea zingiberensis TaxID=325984 RepID=A0A9D5CTJ7_9LILI|nr:hypothetical protein J5N97_013602 [Dioscorea zingiberensis]